MTDGINLVMGDDGVFHETPEPYMTIVVDTEEDWNALQDAVNRGNQMRWISVKDRLPEEYKGEDNELINYLCYMPEYGIDIANFMKPAGIWVCMGLPVKVTHWMPLPEAPKEDEPK